MMLGKLSTSARRPPTPVRRSPSPATQRSPGLRAPGPDHGDLTFPTFMAMATDRLVPTCRTAFDAASVVMNTTRQHAAVPARKCDLSPKSERSVPGLGAPGDRRLGAQAHKR